MGKERDSFVNPRVIRTGARARANANTENDEEEIFLTTTTTTRKICTIYRTHKSKEYKKGERERKKEREEERIPTITMPNW